jgi:type IX secretion system PorP/SprF family membrane protein
MNKLLLVVFFICWSIGNLFAQDPQFTQFYAAQTYLNPAFTGMGNCTRVSGNFRDQWPQIPGKFVSYMFNYDQYFSEVNSSFGLLMTNDRAGSGRLRATTLSLLYAYEVQINYDWRVRAGLRSGLVTRNINMNDLVFGDQLARGGASTSISAPQSEMAIYPDFGAGGLVYSKFLWAGVAIDHLNKPNQTVLNGYAEVPRKFSLHTGARIAIDEPVDSKITAKHSFYPALNYRAQGQFDQLDLGFYYGYQNSMMIGLWYRGIQGFKAYERGMPNNDAVALLLGFTIDQLQIGYSYDYTFSWLRNFHSRGAHEISLNYVYCNTNKKKKRKIRVPCPKF